MANLGLDSELPEGEESGLLGLATSLHALLVLGETAADGTHILPQLEELVRDLLTLARVALHQLTHLGLGLGLGLGLSISLHSPV